MELVLGEAVVKKMGEKAVEPVLNEVNMLANFTEEFEWLKNRYVEINCVLNEANEEGSSHQESVKNWLLRVRDIAWEAEDIVEECAVYPLYDSNTTQFCVLSCKQLILRHQMGTRVQKVKARMTSIVEDGKLLNIVNPAHKAAAESSSSSGSQPQGQQNKRWCEPPPDSKPVGVQPKIESVASLLENPQIPIIAVVGMGGIGKTYLLQHVYNHTKQRYDKSAWLSVSQFYSVSHLQRDLAFQLDEDLCKSIIKSGVSEELGAQLIREFMQEKTCLIVLDDLWRAAREGDFPTKLGIPIGETSRCKILVSTRNRNVFENLIVQIYEMKPLTEEENWRLFCAHAFPKLEGNRAPKELEEVARRILEECGKLPLAIKITAASLATITLPIEWQSKLSKLEKVGKLEDVIMGMLKLSYHSLPAHLKACFAYLSFFPEDEVIECEYLIHLWIGEGLIPGNNPWETAWEYLDQLVSLCLVESWEEEWRLRKYCKVHDLLLDLAILVSRENKCAFTVEDAFSIKSHSPPTGGTHWCRLFLAKKGIDERAISDMRPVSPRLVRTVSLSRNTEIGRRNIPEMLFSGMRVLRVLDLSHTSICTLPCQSVGKMKLLKVLNLSGTKIEEVPKCVRCLKSLTYINLSGCGRSEQSVEAPIWISELKCLRHLQGPFEKLPNGIAKVGSLRTLRISGEWWLSLSTVEEDEKLRLEDVGKMSEVEEIRFKVEHESQLKKMEEGVFESLPNMRRLEIRNKFSKTRSDLPQFPERMSAMRNLQHLRLEYFVVPNWICCWKNLMLLCLQNCDCSNYPELQEMPNLVSLSLNVNRRCRELPKAFGQPKGFPRLRFFSIHDFPKLEVFPEIEDGAMACLEKLELWGCRKMNEMGEGLQRLKRLKEISFKYSGTDELKETFKEGGIYWQTIKAANPEIIIK